MYLSLGLLEAALQQSEDINPKEEIGPGSRKKTNESLQPPLYSSLEIKSFRADKQKTRDGSLQKESETGKSQGSERVEDSSEELWNSTGESEKSCESTEN